MAVRIFTVKRLFLFCFLLIALGLMLLQQNFRPIALNVINSLTEPYNIEVIDVEVKLTELTKFSLTDLNQLNLPWLKLHYQDSLIELTGIKLSLKDGYRSIKNLSLSVEDITALDVKDIQVTLGESFFIRQEQGENTGSIGLSINKIPQISLENISVYLPKYLQQQVPYPIMQTSQLNLVNSNVAENKSTEFQQVLSGKLNLMGQHVLAFDLALEHHQWSLNHQSDIETLHSGLFDLNEALKLVYKSDPEGPEFAKKLNEAIQKIDSSEVSIKGHWVSATVLDLLHGSVESQHQITAVSNQSANKSLNNIAPLISSSRLPGISFSPEKPIHFSLSYVPLSTDKPARAILKLQPFTWQQTTTAEQLEDLISLVNQSQLTQAQVTQDPVNSKSALAYDELIELIDSIDWSLSLQKPLNVEMPLDGSSLINIQDTDAHLAVTHPVTSAELIISDFSVANFSLDEVPDAIVSSNLDSFKMATHLSLNIKQHQAIDFMVPVNETFDSGLNLETISSSESHSQNSKHISLKGSEINLNSKVTTDEQTALLTLLPSSSLHAKQLTLQTPLKSLAFEALAWQLATPSTVRSMDQTNKGPELDRIIEFNVGDFKLGFNEFALKNINDRQLSSDVFEIYLGKFEMLAQQNIKLLTEVPANTTHTNLTNTNRSKTSLSNKELSDDNADSSGANKPLLQQWLSQKNQTQLNWNLKNIRIDKLSPSKSKVRRYKVLRLDNVALNQKLSLQQQLLTGTELWQLDELTLSSYHLLRLPQQGMPVSLAGQWQINTDLDAVLNTLEQTQMLPDNLTISGHNTLNAGFALSENQGVSLFEMKFEQQITQLDAHYNDNFFYDASLNANCQFNWQQLHSTPSQPTTYSQSRLLCQQAELHIADAYMGVNLENINLKTHVSLGKNDEIPAKNWLQEISGLSDTDVNLTASGDLLDGEFLVPEFHLRLHDKSEGYFMLNGISLEALLAAQPQVGVYADGIFDGVLPASLVDGKVTITGGHLAARKPGGLIQVSNNPALEQIRTTQPYLDFVVQALEHLDYSQLSSSFDMADTGDAQLKIQVKGKSQDIERPIHLNYSHEENLFQLYKSTQIGNQLQNDIERSVK